MSQAFTSYIFVFAPPMAVIIAAVLIRGDLRQAERHLRWKLTIGALLLISICIWIGFLTTEGGLGGVVAFILTLITSVVSVAAGLWIASSFHDRRKLAALLVGVAFPISLVLSIVLGYRLSPSYTVPRNGEAIAQALQNYHAQYHSYPKTLSELVPVFIEEIPDKPETMWGWLYMSTNDEFTLGYVYDVDKFGYGVCLYSSGAVKWSCPDGYLTGPFHLAPTPMPTLQYSN